MRTTHHTVAALIFDLAVVDLQIMPVAHTADAVLVTVVQFLGALVPGQCDLWVVDLDLALEGGALVLSRRLISDVFQHSDGLRIQHVIVTSSVSESLCWIHLYNTVNLINNNFDKKLLLMFSKTKQTGMCAVHIQQNYCSPFKSVNTEFFWWWRILVPLCRHVTPAAGSVGPCLPLQPGHHAPAPAGEQVNPF